MIYALAAALWTALAPAAPAGLCELYEPKPKTVTWLNESPSYFAKIAPDGNLAYFIGSGNRMIFMGEDDGQRLFKAIPGDIDPVPCPDGKVVTTPGLNFFEVGALKRDGIRAQAFHSDGSHSGVYQSCAVIASSGNTTTYRMITDESGSVNFRDYKVTFGAGAPTVEEIGTVASLCPGLNLKTLIISKTGKYVSGYVPETGTTQIYSAEPGACKLMADLGFPTGKLEFSYDDSRVVFHMDVFGSQAGDYFSGVDSQVSKEILTLDLERSGERLAVRNLRKLSASRAKGSGSYYPSFTKQGLVGFVHDDFDFYSYRVMDPRSLPAFNLTVPPPEGWPGGSPPPEVPADWEKRLHAAAVVGSLWSQSCSAYDDELGAVDAASLVMSLGKAPCERMVAEQWVSGAAARMAQHPRFARDTRFKSDIIGGLTAADLKAECRTTSLPSQAVTKFYGKKALTDLDGPRALHHYCVGCHVPGGRLRLPDGSSMANPLHFEHLTPDQIQASLARIEAPAGAGRMPPRGFSNDADKKIVVDYLRELMGKN